MIAITPDRPARAAPSSTSAPFRRLAAMLRIRRLVATLRIVLVAAALLTGSRPSTTVAAPSSSDATKSSAQPVLLVLGDSISAEYGLQRGSGWVTLLETRLREQRYGYDVVNASISGETTSGGAARIDELLARVKPAVVIVELGGNDALRGLPLDATQRNLDAIVAKSQAIQASVLLVGMQIPPNYGKAFADRFAAVYTTTAKRRRAALTPFFFAGFADQLDLFQADRIHPVAAAQGRLLDNVWPDLQPLLRRR